MFNFSTNVVVGVVAGVVVGAVAAKYCNDHKEEISAKLKELRKGTLFTKDSGEAGAATEMTLEELESQKERLEDLIADIQAKKQEAK
ncbi:MAG: hypothetical protein SPL30_01335 [Succinivibrio sp.]|jgi:lambda repressor-like predicted transcriptional regulator|nr:hypothetical protein [Succinivibrio sp.]